MEAAIFDLDKTLLPGSSLFPLAREMHRQGYFDMSDVTRMALDQVRYRAMGVESGSAMDRAREQSLEAIRGRPVEEVVEFARAVAREELMPRLYPQAVELVHRHKRADRLVYIASSSPEDYLQILTEELGVDGVLGTRAEVVDGRYTGRLDGPMVHGAEKARRVELLAAQRGIDLARSYAYSDSVNDLPLLELVGNAVAMNPDRRLAGVARQRGWQVLDFRVARRRTLVASATGGGAALVGVAGYAIGYAVGRRRVRRAVLAI